MAGRRSPAETLRKWLLEIDQRPCYCLSPSCQQRSAFSISSSYGFSAVLDAMSHIAASSRSELGCSSGYSYVYLVAAMNFKTALTAVDDSIMIVDDFRRD